MGGHAYHNVNKSFTDATICFQQQELGLFGESFNDNKQEKQVKN